MPTESLASKMLTGLLLKNKDAERKAEEPTKATSEVKEEQKEPGKFKTDL